MNLCIIYALRFIGLAKEGTVGADGTAIGLQQNYPGFPDRVHEGLQDILGDKETLSPIMPRTEAVSVALKRVVNRSPELVEIYG